MSPASRDTRTRGGDVATSAVRGPKTAPRARSARHGPTTGRTSSMPRDALPLPTSPIRSEIRARWRVTPPAAWTPAASTRCAGRWMPRIEKACAWLFASRRRPSPSAQKPRSASSPTGRGSVFASRRVIRSMQGPVRRTKAVIEPQTINGCACPRIRSSNSTCRVGARPSVSPASRTFRRLRRADAWRVMPRVVPPCVAWPTPSATPSLAASPSTTIRRRAWSRWGYASCSSAAPGTSCQCCEDPGHGSDAQLGGSSFAATMPGAERPTPAKLGASPPTEVPTTS